jgi:hypothetical protein
MMKNEKDLSAVIRKLRTELSYAISVFEVNCQCGECRPCQRLIKMKQVLKESTRLYKD